jgi:uncharacterized protein YdgA (DUF945 family)
MKKLVLSVCALSVAGALITPKLIAGKIESNINKLVSEINALHGYQATLTEVSPTWFNTEGVINISFDPKALNADSASKIEGFEAKFQFSADHGPILLKSDNLIGLMSMNVTLADSEVREYLNWAEDKPLYGAKLYGSLLGNITYKDTIEPFNVSNDDGTNVHYKGYQGNGTFSNDEWSYKGISLPLTIASQHDGQVTLGEVEVDIHASASFAQMLETNLYDSDSKFNVKSLSIKDDNSSNNIELENLYIVATSAVDKAKGLGSVGITYGLGSVDFQDFSATDLALAIEVNNISNAFVQAYKKIESELSEDSTEQMQAKLKQFMENNLLTVLEAEPQINITSLRGTLEEGSFESKVNTSLVGITQLPQMLEDPAFWLSHTLADGEIVGDKAVIERIASLVMVSQLKANPQAMNMSEEELEQLAAQQVPQMLQMFMQQGFIVANEKSYTSKFTFKDKALTVNDKQIPLPL